ncbi:MAG: protein translocase subunit SecD [Myxococcota bacterium]
MDRGWYFRFATVLVLVTSAVLALWPSLDNWIPAPQWVKETFEGRISPGLDIQGGLRLMYEVDVDAAIENRRDIMADRLVGRLGYLLGELEEDDANSPTREQREALRDKIDIDTFERSDSDPFGHMKIRVTFTEAADAEALTRDWLREQSNFPDLVETSRTPEDGSMVVRLEIREERIEEVMADAVDRAVKVIENRTDEMAIREMTVIGRETDVIVEIPGGDAASRLVTCLLGAASTAEPDADGKITFEYPRERLLRCSGLTESEADDALRKLGEATYSLSEEEQVSVVDIEGDGYVINDLEEFRQQSMFERVRTIISRTARLEFRILQDESQFVAQLSDLPEGVEKRTEATTIAPGQEVISTFLVASGDNSQRVLRDYVDSLTVPEGDEILLGAYNPAEEGDDEAEAEEGWRTYYVRATTEVSGEDVKDAYVSQDDKGRPVVIIEFNGDGADSFGEMTGQNVKRRMSIVLDNKVESAPVINERIGGGVCQITLGGYRGYDALNREAAELVVVLKAGALPAPISPTNENLVGATLGRDSVERGAQGALVGVILVLVFMLLYYQVAGIVADTMVLLNILFLLATLAFFEATLTLPGVAGIALTIGMAVDANVLITERIREELRLGKSPRSAVDQGFRRAFWSIFDAQLTTFIAGVVLYQYGTGPIKGFAVTLMIGIGTSLFTGVFCSKVMLDWIVRGLRVQRLRVG